MELPMTTIEQAKRLAEEVGIEYGGPQVTETVSGVLHCFREPTTGSSIAVWESELSLDSLRASMKAARVRFGLEE
jgi:hypothetical protein